MSSPERILVADDDPAICMLLDETLQDAGYEVSIAQNGDQLVRMAQSHPPDLLLVDLMMPLMDGFEAIRQLRNDTRTAHLPMIILTARSASSEVVTGFDSGADDYIVKPYDIDVLLARIRGHLRRAAQLPVRNPLTGLPGNVLLQGELQRRVEQEQIFALLYVDLDNFKAFNDSYGFARGDRAIHLLASVLTDHAPPGGFVGHIGGDDFAIVTQGTAIEELCQKIITDFDARVRNLYDTADLRRGYLESVDRHGVMRQFGLLSLSISVVSNRNRQFNSVDQLGKVAAELKTAAKQLSGSSYVIDRRQNTQKEASDERRGQHRPTALLIDPDELIRTALATTLRLQGYHPLIAGDLVAAHGLLARVPEPSLWVARTNNAQIWNLWEQMIAPPPLIAVVEDPQMAEAARVRGAIASLLIGDNPIDLTEQLLLSLPQVVGVSSNDPSEAQAALIRELRTRTAQLEREAYQDGLTGLANRRLFEQRFSELLEECRQADQPICLALIAIDQPDTVGERLSMGTNASVIGAVVETLRHLKRSNDIVARYDTREFALALPETSLQEAIVHCESIRTAIHRHSGTLIGAGTHATLSIGLTDRHNHDESAYTLFAIADQLLVQASEEGGDRVLARSVEIPHG